VTSGEGRILALDLGDARIGVALSDPLKLTAQPQDNLPRVGPRKDIERVRELVETHSVERVIVGNPLRLSGEAGTRSAQAAEFAERLRARLRDVPVELWDERLTTAEAERVMIAGNARRERRKRAVDGLAAVLILQSWLDAAASVRDRDA
jgi:putative Holliday junction resolvase